MLIEILVAVFIGILAGMFTGLIPGIHINLIGVLLISLSVSLLSEINPIYLVTFIVAMAVTHTFIDFIPSIFLGCPDTDTELSVLPGHELLKKGQGYEAIILTNYGSFAAILILIVLLIPSLILIPKTYNLIEKIIPFLLIAVSILLISSEKKKLIALFVLLLTGILGWSVLNLEIIKDPLLPLLTGLFGGSALLLSIKNKIKIPKQNISKEKTTKKELFKPLLGAMIISPICSFLPGLGGGQAAILGSQTVRLSKEDKKGFLILLGATNTIVMGFSFISLYLISKTRTGAATAIQEIFGTLSINVLILTISVMIVTGIISFFLTKFLAKFFAKKIEKVNYIKLSIITLIILTVIVTVFSGIIGLTIFIIATLTGIYCISLNVRRTNMMGCLLIPTILLYLF